MMIVRLYYFCRPHRDNPERRFVTVGETCSLLHLLAEGTVDVRHVEVALLEAASKELQEHLDQCLGPLEVAVPELGGLEGRALGEQEQLVVVDVRGIRVLIDVVRAVL